MQVGTRVSLDSEVLRRLHGNLFLLRQVSTSLATTLLHSNVFLHHIRVDGTCPHAVPHIEPSLAKYVRPYGKQVSTWLCRGLEVPVHLFLIRQVSTTPHCSQVPPGTAIWDASPDSSPSLELDLDCREAPHVRHLFLLRQSQVSTPTRQVCGHMGHKSHIDAPTPFLSPKTW